MAPQTYTLDVLWQLEEQGSHTQYGPSTVLGTSCQNRKFPCLSLQSLPYCCVLQAQCAVTHCDKGQCATRKTAGERKSLRTTATSHTVKMPDTDSKQFEHFSTETGPASVTSFVSVR